MIQYNPYELIFNVTAVIETLLLKLCLHAKNFKQQTNPTTIIEFKNESIFFGYCLEIRNAALLT